MSGRLSLEEIDEILSMLERGVTAKKIATRTGRSENTIGRIKAEYGLSDKLSSLARQAETDKERWLYKYWHWKAPKDQHITPPHKRREKSNFRTPYK